MPKHLLSIKTDDGNIYKVYSDTLVNGDKYDESTDAIYFIESLMCGNEDDYLLQLSYENKNATFYINPSKIVVIEVKDLLEQWHLKSFAIAVELFFF